MLFEDCSEGSIRCNSFSVSLEGDLVGGRNISSKDIFFYESWNESKLRRMTLVIMMSEMLLLLSDSVGKFRSRRHRLSSPEGLSGCRCRLIDRLFLVQLFLQDKDSPKGNPSKSLFRDYKIRKQPKLCQDFLQIFFARKRLSTKRRTFCQITDAVQ